MYNSYLLWMSSTICFFILALAAALRATCISLRCSSVIAVPFFTASVSSAYISLLRCAVMMLSASGVELGSGGLYVGRDGDSRATSEKMRPLWVRSDSVQSRLLVAFWFVGSLDWISCVSAGLWLLCMSCSTSCASGSAVCVSAGLWLLCMSCSASCASSSAVCSFRLRMASSIDVRSFPAREIGLSDVDGSVADICGDSIG